MMKRALLIFLALTACEEVPVTSDGQEVAAPPPPFSPRQPEVSDSSDPCSAGAYLGLIGRQASTINLAETETFRIQRPDFVAVEGDTNPARLNVRGQHRRRGGTGLLRMMRGASLLGIAVMLAGCAGDAQDMGIDIGIPAGPPLPEIDTCGAMPHAALIGVDATALERVLILGQVRVIRPGMAVTQDFRPERINFHIDTLGRLARISCG